MANHLDLKTQKYDRQLRLWATKGQQALEDANICLLNVTSTGCEIIKNLVLPGVGNVTVVDDQKITREAIQNNFFLDPDSVGQSKAKSASELLQELNEDARVKFVEKCPDEIIKNDPEFFEPFSMIIAVNMHESSVIQLATLSHESNKTFINVKNKGLVGLFNIQAPEHTIIETHPENATDLRLATPFQQLSDYVKTYDLDGLDQTDHGQVPFVVVLLKHVEKWREEDPSIQLPLSYKQRKELESKIRANKKTPDEENFDEAIANVWRLGSTENITSEVRQIFEDPSCQSAHSGSPHFWILTRAVRDFVENEGGGQLPLSGKLPDMKSDTLNYIALQKIYREKALSDFESIKRRVHTILEGSEVAIADETIELFCKNALNITTVQYRPLTETNIQPEKLVELIKNEENFSYYLLYKAADEFNVKHGHLSSSGEDFEKFKAQVKSTIVNMGVTAEDAEDIMKSETVNKSILNFVRSNNIEIPNMAALIGGLVAQEAIKLITHQYIPINNTCVFNGITSTSNVFQL